MTVPDCLKQGVAQVPSVRSGSERRLRALGRAFLHGNRSARVREHPKDKAIVERAGQNPDALLPLPLSSLAIYLASPRSIGRSMVCVERINDRRHRRFGVSRRERFETIEKAALKPLPQRRVRRRGVEGGEAASRLLRRRRGRLLQRPAHPSPQEAADQAHREPSRDLPESRAPGDPSAVPPQSRPAHQDPRALPAELRRPSTRRRRRNCCRSRASSIPDLNALFLELFNADVYGTSAPRQGLVRRCTKEINRAGHELASEHIAAAIATMRRYNRYPRAVLPGICSPRRANKPINPRPTARSCAGPAIPCCVTSPAPLQAADVRCLPPLQPRRT